MTAETSMDNVVGIGDELGAPKVARLGGPSVPIGEEYDERT